MAESKLKRPFEIDPVLGKWRCGDCSSSFTYHRLRKNDIICRQCGATQPLGPPPANRVREAILGVLRELERDNPGLGLTTYNQVCKAARGMGGRVLTELLRLQDEGVVIKDGSIVASGFVIYDANHPLVQSEEQRKRLQEMPLEGLEGEGGDGKRSVSRERALLPPDAEEVEREIEADREFEEDDEKKKKEV